MANSQKLADLITKARTEADAFIEAKVQEVKASADGAALPIDWIRNQLRNGHGKCSCAAALAELEKAKQNV